MFIQVIEGRVADPAALRAALDQWHQELAPGADGWLGTTAGVTAGGDHIAVVRFESPEAAQRNSRRPEQDRWWAQTATLFEQQPVFRDCPNVETFLAGGSDQAGFVQVIQGEVSDAARLRKLMPQLAGLEQFRPEIIGGTVAVDQDGHHATQTVYFSSEQAARAGEAKPPPAELQAALAETDELFQAVRYLDLSEPWLYHPAR